MVNINTDDNWSALGADWSTLIQMKIGRFGGADWSTVNLWREKSVSTLLKESIHCMSHHLEWSMKDVFKEIYFDNITELLALLY